MEPSVELWLKTSAGVSSRHAAKCFFMAISFRDEITHPAGEAERAEYTPQACPIQHVFLDNCVERIRLAKQCKVVLKKREARLL